MECQEMVSRHFSSPVLWAHSAAREAVQWSLEVVNGTLAMIGKFNVMVEVLLTDLEEGRHRAKERREPMA